MVCVQIGCKALTPPVAHNPALHSSSEDHGQREIASLCQEHSAKFVPVGRVGDAPQVLDLQGSCVVLISPVPRCHRLLFPHPNPCAARTGAQHTALLLAVSLLVPAPDRPQSWRVTSPVPTLAADPSDAATPTERRCERGLRWRVARRVCQAFAASQAPARSQDTEGGESRPPAGPFHFLSEKRRGLPLDRRAGAGVRWGQWSSR
jgi:hypothetical protein